MANETVVKRSYLVESWTIIEISIGVFLAVLTGLLSWIGREISKTRAAIYSVKSEISYGGGCKDYYED